MKPKKDLLDTKQCAEILGAFDSNQARRWMWNHGMDPRERRGSAHLYARKDVEQVKQERIDWHLNDPDYTVALTEQEIVARVTEHQAFREANTAPKKRRRRKPSSKEYRRDPKPTESLPSDTQPVTCADIDYLASRAGERRRPGQTYGYTEHLLREVQE